MSKLACELCGSANFAKEDGNFVCQECGCKYSLEEAKKLMSGNGAAPSTAPAKKTSNIRQLAMRAKENGDSETAAKYFEQLLMEEPDDWRANFYSIYYAAHNIKIAQIGSAATRVANIIPSTCKLILKQIEDPVEQMEAQLELTTAVINFSNMLFSNITPNLGTTYEIANRNIENWACPTVSMLEAMGDALRSDFKNLVIAKQVYEQAKGYTTHAKDRVYQAGLQHESLTRKISSVQRRIREAEKKQMEKEKAEKEARIKEYWAKNPERHQELLSQKKKLQDQLDSLSKETAMKRRKLQNDELVPPQQAEYEKLTKKINQITAERAGLGIFQLKQKKALQEQCDALREEQRLLEEQIWKYKQDIKKQIEQLDKQLKKDTKSCQDKINKIDNELNRDR